MPEKLSDLVWRIITAEGFTCTCSKDSLCDTHALVRSISNLEDSVLVLKEEVKSLQYDVQSLRSK